MSAFLCDIKLSVDQGAHHFVRLLVILQLTAAQQERRAINHRTHHVRLTVANVLRHLHALTIAVDDGQAAVADLRFCQALLAAE